MVLLQHLLSKNEIAFLSGSKGFTGKQSRDIKYRLNQKLRLLNLDLASVAADFRGGAAELRDDQEEAALVAQPGRALQYSEKDRTMRSLGRELNPRPLPVGDKFEPYLTKVTLYQAELPRQSNGRSSQ